MSTKGFGQMLLDYEMAVMAYARNPSPDRMKIIEQNRAEVASALEARVPSPHSEDFLTPRDEFAKAAIGGMLSDNESSYNTKGSEKHWTEAWARTAYEVADAMMAARQATSTPEGAA